MSILLEARKNDDFLWVTYTDTCEKKVIVSGEETPGIAWLNIVPGKILLHWFLSS